MRCGDRFLYESRAHAASRELSTNILRALAIGQSLLDEIVYAEIYHLLYAKD